MTLSIPNAAAPSADVLARRAGAIALPIAVAALRDRERAADVAQDVVVDVLRGLPRLRDPAAFDAWARRIAVRHVSRALRGRALRRDRERPLDDDALADVADGHDAALVRMSVARALDALPRRQRLAVILRYVHDLSDADVADALGCRVGTAASLLSRARATLRDDPGLRGLIDHDPGRTP
ncbi:MAG TPA: sigma-70 family RNA polymerase sigma factor [Miltoncostaeaceae bacterium]|nr:sigma-70 family RNA polymerase sigma factor [Miltoncostaeaceae bacterium]